jgi:hypothetical protein
MFHMWADQRFEWLAARMGTSRSWRSAEDWRRRDSLLLVGLLAFVVYLLVCVVIFGRLDIVADLGVGLVAGLIGMIALAEGLFAFRPTQERLARADRLVVVAVGTSIAIGGICSLVLLIGRGSG